MKQVINISILAKFFVILSIGISYLDSICFLYTIYGISLQMIGLSILLLTYFVVIYWIKAMGIAVDSTTRKHFVALKIILLIFITTPIFITNELQFIQFHNLETIFIIRICIEIFKIIFIDILVEILSKIINNYKK